MEQSGNVSAALIDRYTKDSELISYPVVGVINQFASHTCALAAPVQPTVSDQSGRVVDTASIPGEPSTQNKRALFLLSGSGRNAGSSHLSPDV